MGTPRKYTYNDKYFAEPNLENSYWAGFIAADGCIYKPGGNKINILSIQLQGRDIDHLESFRDCLDSDRPVFLRHRFTRGKDREYCRLLVTSNEICNDLWANFNIGQRKTLSSVPPNLDGELALAFIAGYIDGDGTYFSNRGRLAIRLIGQEKMLSWMIDVLGSKKKPTKVKNKNLFSIDFYGDSALDLHKKLAHVESLRLKRKLAVLPQMNLNPSGRTAPYEHGTTRMWRTKGCRCDACVDAVNARNRLYYKAKREQS